MNALPPRSRQIVEPFHPTGTVHLHTRMNRAPGEKKIKTHHVVTLSQGTVTYDQFPLPVKNASAVIEIAPDSWVCRDVKGYYEGGELTAFARPMTEGWRVAGGA